jgi:CopZ-like zinc binding protein
VAGNSVERSGKEIRMSKGCSAKSKIGTAPAVLACPVNGARSKQVDILTVKSLVRQLPLGMPDTQYYFCDAPDCEVVYFAQDSKAPTFLRKDLAVRVGAKETAHPIPICYCFGFTRQDLCNEIRTTGKSNIAKQIAAEIKAERCACEVKNPSGKCCLGDVTRTANDMLSQNAEASL